MQSIQNKIQHLIQYKKYKDYLCIILVVAINVFLKQNILYCHQFTY